MAGGAPAQAEGPSHGQPNVLLLIIDDLGYGELGCQGNPEIPTPNIDSLAASGVRCTQAYVTAPNCSPSRAGIFSGRVPTRFGYEFNPTGAQNEEPKTGLPNAELTLPEFMRSAGYVTGLVGKWHLGGAPPFHPLRHGFDEFFGFLHEGHFYVPPPYLDAYTMLRRAVLPAGNGDRYHASDTLVLSTHTARDEPPYDANNPILRGGQPVVERRYLTDAFTDEAIDFLERNRRVPFFLTVSYNAVHSPLQAKSETFATMASIEGLQRRVFAAMLADVDTSVGRIVERLAQLGLAEDTLVVLLSDNGGPTQELTSSNLPLRGGKGEMYEGGLRVPFLVSWPGRAPAGQVCDKIVSSLDIYATAARLSGRPLPSRLEGQDLLPVIADRGAASSHETLYWRQGHLAALRHGDWKIVAASDTKEPREWELYHVAKDIDESENFAGSRPEVLAELETIWSAMDRQMSRPLFQ
ncbi:Arylsulfatase [Pirellulimonas nuda]|uniref:Arylsulfatase n=1 Tax=Pirellulimonas nuda TaxID=2528009 RepID=A0A518DAU7_9BACT|nr:Arylsulfatase [Pirellulimonas nuda]